MTKRRWENTRTKTSEKNVVYPSYSFKFVIPQYQSILNFDKQYIPWFCCGEIFFAITCCDRYPISTRYIDPDDKKKTMEKQRSPATTLIVKRKQIQ